MASETKSAVSPELSASGEQLPPVDVEVNVLLSTSGQAPSPSKDFYQLLVKQDEVIWRVWRITLHPNSRFDRPTQLTQSHNDFLHDVSLQAVP
uniref:F-box only protein 36 isoform X2 n=1 Tax=Myxine glutinosa TaxID=7769 RepID=UPI00358EFA07